MHRPLPYATLLLFTFAVVGFADSLIYTTIDDPNTTDTVLTGINNSGQIVGYGQNIVNGAPTAAQGFLYTGGTFSPISFPNTAPQFGTEPNGINDSGSIVGTYAQVNNPQTGSFSNYAFVYAAGNYTSLSALGANSGAQGINASGVIVGEINLNSYLAQAFVLQNGNYSYFTHGGGGLATGASAINADGDIVGYFDTYYNRDPEGYVRYANGQSTKVLCCSFDGFPQTVATGINDEGWIVGDSLTYTNNTFRTVSFLLVNGVYYSLDIPTSYGVVINGINDSDEVVGYYSDGNGNHGFIANVASVVTPEPTQLGLLGIGIVSLVAFRVRRRVSTLR
jgi:uncharacterized membrane protein